jgi:hypothetical protein
MRRATAAASCLSVICAVVTAAPAWAATPVPTPLAGFSFLVGDWKASGSGDPGRSTGEFSFEWAAGRRALVRRNEAITPGGRHTDFMLVYSRPDGAVRAVYVDSEGHTIEYDVTIAADQRRIVFESVGVGPRFRLWYQAKEDGSLATGFQIAQPGASEFRTYLEGVAQRR